MTEEHEIQGALRANQAFYEALAGGQSDEMEQIWATTTPVICVHPGGPPLRGLASILESWRRIAHHPPQIEISDVQAEIIRGLAAVTCFEHIGETLLAATNLFVWEENRWAMACHQSGPVQIPESPSPPAQGPLH
ncbi:MAG: hypothetical protein CBC48_04000 [bacterium TMED88]|nr:DUF4440 domain-containing protein [Deltaproteobacteria bacterium]OUV35431.1 MAG: hypothetical protein CBC48_04000 [bacterium TMED88]